MTRPPTAESPSGRKRASENIIAVTESLTILRSELLITASRSSGAGGQHVNKTSSRIEISWNVKESPSLTDEQRAMLLIRLASRLSSDGSVRVVASDTRSQLRNRQKAEERLADLVRRSLVVKKKRRPTRRPRAANEARLTRKKQIAEKKIQRRPPTTDRD